MELGNKILEMRKNKKLSQEQLAEKINVTRQTISNWELGETNPNPNQLKLLSSVLGVSVDELLDNDVKEIVVEKVSNVEKLAGVVITGLKILGIILVVIVILNIVSIFLFGVKNNSNSIEETMTSTVSLNCSLDGKDYTYLIETDKNDKVISAGGSEFIERLVKDKKEYTGKTLVQYIISYFEDNGGTCK